jgi:hypothetical protein
LSLCKTKLKRMGLTNHRSSLTPQEVDLRQDPSLSQNTKKYKAKDMGF